MAPSCMTSERPPASEPPDHAARPDRPRADRPGELGVTLPHEHTQIALWHIANRWDYWQLTRDEPVMLDELAAFKQAGGGTLVDLTLPGVGRDPLLAPDAQRAERPQRRDGLWLVSHRVLPAGGAHRPADRSTTSPRSSSARRPRASTRPGSAPGSSARSAPTSRGSPARRSGCIGPPRERRRRQASPITTHGVLSDVGRAQLRVFEEEGVDPARVVIGHADSYPHLAHQLSIVETGASVEFDFLGMSFSARPERLGEGRVIDLLLELLSRGHAERILLSQDVCHDSQLASLRGPWLHVPRRDFLPRLRAPGRLEDEIRHADRRQPEAAPHDRLTPRRAVKRRDAVDLEGDVALPAPG